MFNNSCLRISNSVTHQRGLVFSSKCKDDHFIFFRWQPALTTAQNYLVPQKNDLSLITQIAPAKEGRLSFFRYFYNGLGYKVFIRGDYLVVWIGLTHYTLLRIPSSIKIFAKKRRFFIIGWDKFCFNDFIAKLRRIRRTDLYKAKGLSEVRTYKGFLKMKSGKKKQY